MKVCWFSGGVSSFVACYLTKDIDKIIYTHIENQHPDTLRFIKDCEKFFPVPVEILQSEYFKSVDDVIMTTGYITTANGAPCTDILKRQVRKKWERENPGKHCYIWGFDIVETNRAENLVEAMPNFRHEFPLIKNHLTKANAHYILNKLGIKRPVMYDLGYQNNNCIGCVKGGMWYWNKIRVDFPEVFQRRAAQERILNKTCLKGNIYLDELDPLRGRKQDEIMGECGIACTLRGY